MKKSNKGFTLIELLVVIVIAGIGLSLAVPGFQGMMARNRVSTQTNEMILAINLARSEASRAGGTVSIQAAAPVDDDEFGAGWCVVIGTPGNCDDDDGELLRRFDPLSGNTTLNAIENAGEGDSVESISFNSRGGLTGTNDLRRNLDLCVDGQRGNRIQITLTGRPKSYREAEAGDLDPPAIQPAC
jgi:type IV fimbrial biogenesis protein FimT